MPGTSDTCPPRSGWRYRIRVDSACAGRTLCQSARPGPGARSDVLSRARRGSWPGAPRPCLNGQGSAAAVGAVGPGRDEQRHVVVGVRVGDPEADGHAVEEVAAAEVVADGEHELV